MGDVQESGDGEIVDKGSQVKGTRESIDTDLNGICPYFTMFPLDFPLNIGVGA